MSRALTNNSPIFIALGRRALHVSAPTAVKLSPLSKNLPDDVSSQATKFGHVHFIPAEIRREVHNLAVKIAQEASTLPLPRAIEIEAADYLRNYIKKSHYGGSDLIEAVKAFNDKKTLGFVIEDVIEPLALAQCQNIKVDVGQTVKTDSATPDYVAIANKVKTELPNHLLLSALLHPLVLAPQHTATPIYVLASREEGVAPQFEHVDILIGDGDKGSAVNTIALTAVFPQQELGRSYGVSTYAVAVNEILKYFTTEEIDFLSKKLFIETPEVTEYSAYEDPKAKHFSILQPNGRGGYAMSWDGNGGISITPSANSSKAREILTKISWVTAHLISQNLAAVVELNNSMMVFRNYDEDGHVLHGRIESGEFLGEGGLRYYPSDPNKLFARPGIHAAADRQVTRTVHIEPEKSPEISKKSSKSLAKLDSTQTKTQVR